MKGAKRRRLRKSNNHGFTLVELIVVLVILAILAAILVPALLGYIDSARDKQYMLNARNCMTAAQAELIELYGTTSTSLAPGDCIVPGGKNGTDMNGDFDVSKTQFAQDVLTTADMTGDNAPYLFMVAVGSNWKKHSDLNSQVSDHDKYTIFYAVYIESESAPTIYYYNGDWQKANPRANGTNAQTEIFNDKNVVKQGDLEGKRLQYYMISNKTGKGNVASGGFWTWLKGRNK